VLALRNNHEWDLSPHSQPQIFRHLSPSCRTPCLQSLASRSLSFVSLCVVRVSSFSLFPQVHSPLNPVFFAHCHPHRLFIHQPTFMADVSSGHIPSYPLYVLCALSATFSKHHAVRTESDRSPSLCRFGMHKNNRRTHVRFTWPATSGLESHDCPGALSA
jgi:hypothetical protein